MWVLFGTAAIVTAVFNVVWTVRHREAKWFRFVSLSFTALTLCAFYSQAAHWAACSDFGALLDVMPAMSGILWFLTGASVMINGISLFAKGTRSIPFEKGG